MTETLVVILSLLAAGPNLLVNGGAEQWSAPEAGHATLDAGTAPPWLYADRVLTGWTDTAGVVTNEPYGITHAEAVKNTPPLPEGGARFGSLLFIGGFGIEPGATASISQRVELPANAGPWYTAAGWFGGFGSDRDDAGLTVAFFDESGTEVGRCQLGPVTPEQRGERTQLVYESHTDRVPDGARTALVTLSFSLFTGSFANGMADELSLTLHEEPIDMPNTSGGTGMPRRGISAHRGASRTHPENTLAAFREAIRLGAHQIEFDVVRIADDSLVVIHDNAVDRTTDGQGDVRDMTLDEVKRLDAGGWKHPMFRGERVPTLRETLAMMPINIWLNVHMRGGDPEAAREAAREIAFQDRLHQAFLHLDAASHEAVRQVEPGVLICNIEHGNRGEAYVQSVLDRGCSFIQFFIGEPMQTQRLKDADVRINFCCTNSPSDVTRLFEMGTDFILVDDLAPMLRAAAAAGVEPCKPVYRRRLP